MKKFLFLFVLFMLCLSLVACGTPVGIEKCYTDYEYTADGKLKQEYKECVRQTPEKMSPLTLKHKDLMQ